MENVAEAILITKEEFAVNCQIVPNQNKNKFEYLKFK